LGFHGFWDVAAVPFLSKKINFLNIWAVSMVSVIAELVAISPLKWLFFPLAAAI
jgi:hypothetical protein